ncbi:MAG TPA: hypothetical protein VGF89_07555 [Steroidobacteraceae bacterium]|jgi:hypothetical protein
MQDISSSHRQTWDLIPWIVNGTASESEWALAQAHLDRCADCRQELEFQRGLRATIAAQSNVEGDVRESWQRLSARLDSAGKPEPTPRTASRRPHSGRGARMPWLVAAMVVQAIGLAALGAVLWSRPLHAPVAASASAPYRTLSAPESQHSSATVRVVFAPAVTVAQMQSMLAAARLQVLAGPSEVGVWTLGPALDSNRAATEAALRELRTRPEVRFAEAVAGAP